MLDSATLDAKKPPPGPKKETPAEKRAFAQIRRAERTYAAQLRKVAKAVDDLVKGMHPHDREAAETLRRMLERYAELLRPWAAAQARRILADVERREKRAWIEHARALGIGIQAELLNVPIGGVYHQLMNDQVELITSLPLQAAERVHQLVSENLVTGERAEDLAKKILETGHVTKSRAMLIARTETSRASTALTQARSQFIGATHYRWMAVMDYRTRPELGIKNFKLLNTLPMGSHRKLHGTIHAWDDPPIADPKGIRAHPGSIWNCRCYAEPVIPEGY